MSIRENWEKFRTELEETALQYGRVPDDITVMAVSKTRSVAEITEAGSVGLSLFGENRVEEASEKFTGLDAVSFPLYLIGHLQSNKVARVGPRFNGVHSVDSIKIAKRLSRHREQIEQPLEVLIQVNTSGEESKTGFKDPGALAESAHQISEMPFLKLKGLMTMAPFVDQESVVRRCFADCREWADRIKGIIDGDAILSMGMSSDFRWAVAEGSTMLRIGTTIFGGR